MPVFYFKDTKWGGLVYILLSVSIMLIAITGFISYRRISDSLNNLNSKIINQDFELSSIKDIRLNYARIDNMMEMFLITHKSFYRGQVDSSYGRTKNLIAGLKTSQKLNREEQSLIDTIKTLLTDKVKNLNSITQFQQNASIEKLIEDYMNMQSIRSAMDRERQELVRKKNIWQKLGLAKKKEEAKEPQHSPDEIVIDKQDLFNISDSSSINPFLKRDHEINVSFMDLCRLIETMETDRLDSERKLSESKIKGANTAILMLGTCTALFILMAGISYFRYIRKLAEVRKSLSNSKEIAEEMTIIKERFMANMSHEIRTPLNAISGFVDQLHSSNITIKQKKQTEIIQKSIQHILNIVNDILDFSKLNAGKLTLSHKGFEIEPLVQQTVESLQPLVAEKNIEISCSLDENIPSILIGDAYRLKQILLNVIGNAIKYTNAGSIRVSVNCRELGKNWFEVEFIVKDTGIGIDKADLNNIFKEFHMAENARWTKSGSTGLGLSITKMLVELYHGHISIDSKLNEGTAVSVKIPFQGGTAIDLSVESNYLSNLDFLRNKKILIADDEPFNRVLLNNILHKYKADIYEAENGLQVLSMLEKEHFDCILMDLKMPEMDGLETSKRIRKSGNPGIENIPIVAVSAAISSENFSFLQKIGVDSYIEKPFKENELLNLLYKIVDRGPDLPPPGTAPEPEPVNPHNPGGNEMFDVSELQRQSGNDQRFISDMLLTLIDSTRKGIQEIEVSLDKNEWENVNLVAHRIATPLKFIFAKDTYETVKQIERDTEQSASKDKAHIRDEFENFKEKFTKLEVFIREYLKNHPG